MKHEKLTWEIINAAMHVHSVLGSGFNEKVYRLSLVHELHKRGMCAESEKGINVFYDSVCVGKYKVDILAEREIIIEIKIVKRIIPVHFKQVKNYLKATNNDTGLLLNFELESLEYFRVFSKPAEY